MFAFFLPGPVELLVLCGVSIFLVLPFWMICSKAGFPGWISLAVLVPVLNLVLLFFLAFADWPALQGQSDDIHSGPLE